MICNTILDAIGNTPIIRLNKLTDDTMAEILVKFEGLNVGGSIKTRTAEAMVAQAEAQGIVTKDTIIVEPTSGNQGIGIALVGAVKGYETVIIMPDCILPYDASSSGVRFHFTAWVSPEASPSVM